MKLFLDACCLNRPFDDQNQARVFIEAAATLQILKTVVDGRNEMVTSDTIEREITKTPDTERRGALQRLLALARVHIALNDQDVQRALALRRLGFRANDALHLACAERGTADSFLSVDDQLLRCARRNSGTLAVRVEGPVTWLARIVYDNEADADAG